MWIFAKEKYWAKLPLASKAVLPVIASFQNAKGECYPSESTIANLAGCTCKTARAGIKRATMPYFSYKYENFSKGRVRKYFFNFPNFGPKGEVFPFFKSIIESKQWANLSMSAKTVYPVLRALAVAFDSEKYSADIGSDSIPFEWHEIFRDRQFEYVNSSITKISMLCGLPRMSIYNGIKSLKSVGLVQNDNFYKFRVMVRSEPL